MTSIVSEIASLCEILEELKGYSDNKVAVSKDEYCSGRIREFIDQNKVSSMYVAPNFDSKHPKEWGKYPHEWALIVVSEANVILSSALEDYYDSELSPMEKLHSLLFALANRLEKYEKETQIHLDSDEDEDDEDEDE